MVQGQHRDDVERPSPRWKSDEIRRGATGMRAESSKLEEYKRACQDVLKNKSSAATSDCCRYKRLTQGWIMTNSVSLEIEMNDIIRRE